MPEIEDRGPFRLEGGVLCCPEDMNSVRPKELRVWCGRLLDSPEAELVVDLTDTRYMASVHLGILSESWSESLRQGRKFKVRISPELRRLFELSGFDQVFQLADGPES